MMTNVLTFRASGAEETVQVAVYVDGGTTQLFTRNEPTSSAPRPAGRPGPSPLPCGLGGTSPCWPVPSAWLRAT